MRKKYLETWFAALEAMAEESNTEEELRLFYQQANFFYRTLRPNEMAAFGFIRVMRFFDNVAKAGPAGPSGRGMPAGFPKLAV